MLYYFFHTEINYWL